MAAIIVWLECITNMHVGNGDVNYNIVDNEVERDPVSHYPTIHSSGVKGALREYFTGNKKEHITEIFGADQKKETGIQAGRLKFLAADMIAVPFRASKGNQAYYLVTTQTAVDRYQEVSDIFLHDKIAIKVEQEKGAEAEGNALEQKITLNGKDMYILKEGTFRRLSLPVLARNKLENGKSVNLWYEEVVPHKSIFAFAVTADESDRELLTYFKEQVDGQILQFGGNASIGYGLCKATVMEEKR